MSTVGALGLNSPPELAALLRQPPQSTPALLCHPSHQVHRRMRPWILLQEIWGLEVHGHGRRCFGCQHNGLVQMTVLLTCCCLSHGKWIQILCHPSAVNASAVSQAAVTASVMRSDWEQNTAMAPSWIRDFGLLPFPRSDELATYLYDARLPRVFHSGATALLDVPMCR